MQYLFGNKNVNLVGYESTTKLQTGSTKCWQDM